MGFKERFEKYREERQRERQFQEKYKEREIKERRFLQEKERRALMEAKSSSAQRYAEAKIKLEEESKLAKYKEKLNKPSLLKTIGANLMTASKPRVMQPQTKIVQPYSILGARLARRKGESKKAFQKRKKGKRLQPQPRVIVQRKQTPRSTNPFGVDPFSMPHTQNEKDFNPFL